MDLEPVGQLYEIDAPVDEQGRIVIDAWLDLLEIKRRARIMELRQIDDILVEYGRLSEPTLPRRDR